MEFLLELNGIENEQARTAFLQLREFPGIEALQPKTTAADGNSRSSEAMLFTELLIKSTTPVLSKFFVYLAELFRRPGAGAAEITIKTKGGSIILKMDPRSIKLEEMVQAAQKLAEASRAV